MSNELHDQTMAFVVADTVHPDVPEARITTIQYRAPRFLLAEINTHGLLAKSAASSRAIPIERRIKEVDASPFVPPSFGRNKRGMQSDTLLNFKESIEARQIWNEAASNAVESAKLMAKLQIHKQTANRVLEPFVYVNGVITATEWDNFFRLRLDKAAQPEFQRLARAMREAIDKSTPRESKEHLPYVPDETVEYIPRREDYAWRVSAARCARVSYLSNATASQSTIMEDDDLCSRLLADGHMSPFDHAARADYIRRDGANARWVTPEAQGRYWGWIPKRYDVEQYLKVTPARRNPYDAFKSQGGSIRPGASMVLAPDVTK